MREFPVKKKITAFVILLCSAGFFVALYLAWLHYQVHTNPSFHSFCAMNDTFNCETVAESPYSVFLTLPIAIWGLLGYFLMFVVALAGIGRHQSSGAYLTLLGASIFSVLVSLVLAIVSYCVICSFCVMCSITYGLNVIMLMTLLWQAIRLRLPMKPAATELFSFLRKHWHLPVMLLLAVLVVFAVFPRYWVHQNSVQYRELRQGMTTDGHPCIGAENATLVIVEFSDYMCPHCRRAHAFQRSLVSANPKTLRLVHRHFPLDHACNPLVKTPFHPGACFLSRAALCAGEQHFWEMNDLLYASNNLTGDMWEQKVDDAARRIGLNLSRFRECLVSEETQRRLDEDITEGLRLKLEGTPSFVVDGKIHTGMIDPAVLQNYGVSPGMK